MNILFINPPSLPYTYHIGKLTDGTGANYILRPAPLGICYLSSAVKAFSKVSSVEILDFIANLENQPDHEAFEAFVDDLICRVEIVPDVIAWSMLFSTSHAFFELIAPRLKEKWPGAISIAGGAHPTNATAIMFADNLTDYVARGESEMSFSKFINQLVAGEPVDVYGIYDRDKLERQGGNPVEIGEMPTNLDTLPLPDWELLDMPVYLRSSLGFKRDFGSAPNAVAFPLMTSRGCTFKCTFCGSHTVHGRRMRYHSVERVIQEVSLLHQRYGVNLIIPEDDLFTANKARTKELLNAIKDLKIPDIELQCPNALSVNTLDEELIDLLESVGMRICTLAIESGSPFVQNEIIKKRCNLDKARRLVKYVKSRDMYCRCYYVLGFPGETREMIEETIQYARDLGADWANFNVAVPLLGSEMYDQFFAMGVLTDHKAVWASDYGKRTFDTPEMGAAELVDLQYRANIDVNFLNNPLVTGGQYGKAITVFADILRHYPFHIFAMYMTAVCHRHLGQNDKAESALADILARVDTDECSQDQLFRFGNLIPDLQTFLLSNGRAVAKG